LAGVGNFDRKVEQTVANLSAVLNAAIPTVLDPSSPMASWSAGLGHTAINVADAAVSVDWYAKTLGFLISDNLIGPDGESAIGAFMRCDQGDMPVDHHTLNNVQIMGEPRAAFGHAGYEVTDSVDDLMAGHYHMKTVDKYYHEWGIGRHLLGSQMYDYWRDPTGFTHEHWTDGDLLDASVTPTDTPARDLIMAQYAPGNSSFFWRQYAKRGC
jgi:catechol 2,3-dioxygenase-like lactoylglutathione lyase family enzyme